MLHLSILLSIFAGSPPRIDYDAEAIVSLQAARVKVKCQEPIARSWVSAVPSVQKRTNMQSTQPQVLQLNPVWPSNQVAPLTYYYLPSYRLNTSTSYYGGSCFSARG